VKNASVLIIEDDRLEAEQLSLNLRQAGYFIAGVVSSVEQTMPCVESQNVDLIVADIVMPGEIDGIDIVKLVRQNYDIPFIFLTAHVSDELLLRAEQTRPFAYILKPYRLHELLFTVKMALTRAEYEKQQLENVKEAQNKLHQAQAIIQHTNEGIMLTDTNDIILSVNPAFTQITGFKESEAIGHKTSFLKSGKHDQSFYSEMWKTLLKDGHWQGEIWNKNKNGKIYPEWLTINAIGGIGDVTSSYVGVFSDISSIKNSEQERVRLQKELNQTHKMEALGRLSGGIAHDFNNVLGIIMGYIDLAIKRYDSTSSDKIVNYLQTAMTASTRAKSLIEQMLIFSHKGISNDQSLQLTPLIQEILEMLRPITPSSIIIDFNSQDALPNVLIATEKLQQLMMNLCINARDAMKGKGNLSIDLRHNLNVNVDCSCCHKSISGNWLILSVSDTGSGMDSTTLEHLFDPFYTTKKVGDGLGMGMSVLHGIMRQYGGHILVESEIGAGSTIRLLFEPMEYASDADAAKHIAETPALINNRHILVVDDEPMLTEYISDLLETRGYRTTGKASSEEALATFTASPEKYNLLVTDQSMPNLTGLQLITQVRKIRPDLPVILCSGFSEDVNSQIAEEIGIPYLGKPINADHFVLLVKKLLD